MKLATTLPSLVVSRKFSAAKPTVVNVYEFGLPSRVVLGARATT